MATIMKISDSDLREARRAGFKRKKPKKGKLKTRGAIEGYIDRNNRWVKDAKDKTREYKKKESEKVALKKLRETIRRS